MITFVIKHAVAAAVLIAGAAVSIVAVYFALFALAIVTNSGLGGPLALPGLVLVAVAAAVISIAVFLFPVTAIAEFVRSRVLRTNRLIEIPISSLLLLAMLAAVIVYAGAGVRAGMIVAAIEMLLLGVYWWTLQATSTIVRLATFMPRMAWRITTSAPTFLR